MTNNKGSAAWMAPEVFEGIKAGNNWQSISLHMNPICLWIFPHFYGFIFI
jgi:hypothetical protein